MSRSLQNLSLFALSFALCYVFIFPLYTGVANIGFIYQPERSLSSLQDLNTSYDNTISQAADLVKQAGDLKNQYEKIGPDVKDKLNIMIPKDVDPVRLMSEVSGILVKSNFAPDDITYTKSASLLTDNLNAYTVNVTVKGSYEKFKDLINNFETSMRLFSIKSVTFSSSDQSDAPISFQIKLDTYYLK